MPDIDTETRELAAIGGPALEAVREELVALPDRDLHPLNVDLASVATLILGAAPIIRRYRAELVATFGEPTTAAAVDRLELLARATLQAHAAYRALESGADVQQLSAEVVKVREVLFADVRTLILRGVLPRGAVGELQGTKGFKNQSLDVIQLASVMTDHWDVVEPQTGLDLGYIRRAEAAAHALVSAVGARSLAARSPAGELRQRAFTLLASTYDDARRMISFLRWKHGDADRIAPSIFSGRGNGRRSKPRAESEVVGPVVSPSVLGPSVVGPSPDVPGADPFPAT